MGAVVGEVGGLVDVVEWLILVGRGGGGGSRAMITEVNCFFCQMVGQLVNIAY